MATLITKTSNTAPVSTDVTYVVDDPAGTPVDNKVTLGNLVTKAHGLSDGAVVVSSGVMTNDTDLTNLSTAWTPASAAGAASLDFLEDTDNGVNKITLAAPASVASDTTATLPNETDTLIGKATTDALTNKTLTSATNTLGAVTLGIGSDASIDLLYNNAGVLGRFAKGSGLQVLRMNSGATGLEWATNSAGQSTYDAIVAPTGGDYTTLGAAIAAASAGWSIFVKEGTYSETTITTALNNLRIVGESRETVIFQPTTTAWTFSGTGVQLENFQFNPSTGRLILSGTNSSCNNIYFKSTGSVTQPAFQVTANNSQVQNSYFESTSTASRSDDLIYASGNYIRFENCHFKINTLGSNSNHAGIEFNGTASALVGCTFEKYTGGEGGGSLVRMVAANGVVSSCTFNGWSATTTVLVVVVGGFCSVTGNTFYGSQKAVALESAQNVVSGNNIADIKANPGYGIYDASGTNVITGNYITTQAGATTHGIFINTSVTKTTVSGNYISNFTNGVNIGSGATGISVVGNNFDSNTNNLVNSGSATIAICKDNYGVPVTQETMFVRMKNTSGATINAGNIVTLKAVAAGDEVTTTTTAGTDATVYGMAGAAILNNAYGMIQIKGKTQLMTVDGTTDIAIGDFITTFTTVGIGRKAATGEFAIAIALEAYTTNDSAGVIDAILINPIKI